MAKQVITVSVKYSSLGSNVINSEEETNWKFRGDISNLESSHQDDLCNGEFCIFWQPAKMSF